MNTTESSAETFSYDPNTMEVVRDSDREVMATVDPSTGDLTFTHHSRERNYGKPIRELITALDFPNSEHRTDPVTGKTSLVQDFSTAPGHQDPPAPVPESELPEIAPPADPVLGSYSHRHLLFDHGTLSDSDFLAKWGGPMTLSTKRTVESRTDFGPAAAEIIARIS